MQSTLFQLLKFTSLSSGCWHHEFDRSWKTLFCESSKLQTILQHPLGNMALKHIHTYPTSRKIQYSFLKTTSKYQSVEFWWVLRLPWTCWWRKYPFVTTHDFSKFLKLHVMKEWCINDKKWSFAVLHLLCRTAVMHQRLATCSRSNPLEFPAHVEQNMKQLEVWRVVYGNLASILIILHLKPWSICNPNRSSCRLSIRASEKVACHDSTGLGMDHPSRSWREAFFHLHGEKINLEHGKWCKLAWALC